MAGGVALHTRGRGYKGVYPVYEASLKSEPPNHLFINRLKDCRQTVYRLFADYQLLTDCLQTVNSVTTL